MPIDKGTTLPITQLSGLQLNYKDSNSCFNLPIMTTNERDAIINTNDPANPIKNGTMIFNSDDNLVQYYQITTTEKKWIDVKSGAGTGDVVGPPSSITGNLASFSDDTGKGIKDSGISTDLVVSASSESIQKSQIPVWDTTTKGKITLSNSGVNVSKIQSINAQKNVNESELYLLSNLGALQFGNSENVADTGVILLDGLTPVTFQMQGTGANSRVCTVINGEIGEGSSSPSAILEINSTVGSFLNARLNIAQRDALVDPVDGMMIFNTDSKTINSRQNGEWISLETGSGSGTVTSVGLTNTDKNLTITGSPVTTSGNIQVNLNSNPVVDSLQIQNSLTIFNNNGFGLWLYGNSSFCSMITSSSKLAMNTTFVLPLTNGSSGQVLSTDGKGNTSWVNNSADLTASYLLTEADSNLPNATILPVLTNHTATAHGLYIGPNCGNTTAMQNAYYSLGVGSGALNGLQSGNGNVALGYTALQALQNGSYNIAIGQSALQLNYRSNSATDAPNLAIGYQSLMTAGDSYGNIAIGHQTLQGVVSTQSNTVIGYQSMSTVSRNSTGSNYNTAVGYQTLYNIDGSTSSSYNTVIGYKAGSAYTSYKNCTFLGANTDTNQAGLQYATAIGYGTIVKQNNSYAIGSEESRWAVGIGIGAPHYTLHLNNTFNYGPGGGFQTTCSILLTNAAFEPYTPIDQYSVCLWANKGNKNGALFFKSDTGGVYKIDSTSADNPASEPKIPVLTADEIQALTEIALGAIVYDSTNDTVIISTKSGWQNLTRSLYNPQNSSTGI